MTSKEEQGVNWIFGPREKKDFNETLEKMKTIFPEKDFTPHETEYVEPKAEDIECVPQLTREDLDKLSEDQRLFYWNGPVSSTDIEYSLLDIFLNTGFNYRPVAYELAKFFANNAKDKFCKRFEYLKKFGDVPNSVDAKSIWKRLEKSILNNWRVECGDDSSE